MGGSGKKARGRASKAKKNEKGETATPPPLLPPPPPLASDPRDLLHSCQPRHHPTLLGLGLCWRASRKPGGGPTRRRKMRRGKRRRNLPLLLLLLCLLTKRARGRSGRQLRRRACGERRRTRRNQRQYLRALATSLNASGLCTRFSNVWRQILAPATGPPKFIAAVAAAETEELRLWEVAAHAATFAVTAAAAAASAKTPAARAKVKGVAQAAAVRRWQRRRRLGLEGLRLLMGSSSLCEPSQPRGWSGNDSIPLEERAAAEANNQPSPPPS
jgi:hypothetical protein